MKVFVEHPGYTGSVKYLVTIDKGWIEYADKTDATKGGGEQRLTLTYKGGGGVGEMLILADKFSMFQCFT